MALIEIKNLDCDYETFPCVVEDLSIICNKYTNIDITFKDCVMRGTKK
jgi:hypothetical protein